MKKESELIPSEHSDDELALLLLHLHPGDADSKSQDQNGVTGYVSQQLAWTHPPDVVKAGLLQRQVVNRAWKMQQGAPVDRLLLPQTSCATRTEPWNLSPSEMRKRRLPLPFKLYSILMNPRYHFIVSWLPGGRIWKIHDLDAFKNEILPQYFDYGSYPPCSYNIFHRLLKLWNFSPHGDEGALSYFHKEFLAEKPELMRNMRPGDFPKVTVDKEVTKETKGAAKKAKGPTKKAKHANVVVGKLNTKKKGTNANSHQKSTSKCVELEDFLKAQQAAQQTAPQHPRKKQEGQSFPPCILQSLDVNAQVLQRLVSQSRKSKGQAQLAGFNRQFKQGMSLKPSLKTKKLFEPVGSLNEFKFQVSMELSFAKGMHDKFIRRLKAFSGTRITSPSLVVSAPAAQVSSSGTKRPLVKTTTSMAMTKHPSPPIQAKRRRRSKWLPPLGPPTMASTIFGGMSGMNWIFKSPEAFSTLTARDASHTRANQRL